MTKKLKRLIGLLLAAVTICSALVFTGSAASLSKVSGLKVVSTDDDEINLKWSAVTGATGYQIYVKVPGGSWKKNETTKKTTEDAENLKSGTTYYVAVRAYKKSGSKVTYGSFTKVKTSTDPAEVKSLTATAVSSGKSTLSWKAVTGATGYQIYKYNTSTGKWAKTATVKTTKYTATVSKNGGDRFKVRAYKKLDSKVYYGDFESVTVKAATTSSTKISASQAKSIAIKDSGVSSSTVKDYDCEYEYSKSYGCYVYEVEFESGNYEYDYIINASTGKILYSHKERA
ncbi:MAG: fibronectin type III domain-containing protein [Acutalibacteraceae bacterium]